MKPISIYLRRLSLKFSTLNKSLLLLGFLFTAFSFNNKLNGQCNGAADAIAPGTTGITNQNNAIGQPNGTFAQVYELADVLIFDLGTTLPVGSDYALVWRKRNTGTIPADAIIQESADNITFTPNTTIQNANSLDFTNTKIVAQVPTRYVRITMQTNTEDDFQVEALVYRCPDETFPFIPESCNGNTTLFHAGNTAVTCAVSTNQSIFQAYTFALISVNDGVPAVGKDTITNMDSVYHHPSWHVDSIGNVFGIAVNDFTREIFLCASSNYGTRYFGIRGIIRYGEIGGGENSLNAAGTVYRVDAVTGQASVFAVLPQQSSTVTHRDCEDDALDIVRNTGVGLGNIVYDSTFNQYFVTNIEDGRIYRLASDGTILESYDPFTQDNNAPGITNIEEIPYGLAVEPGSGRLFFGALDQTTGTGFAGVGAPGVYSIDLDVDGSFIGTINNNAATPPGIDNIDGTETLHITIPTGSGFSYSSNTMYQISDLEFTPDNELLVGVRIACYSTWFSSYNHFGETNIVSLNTTTNLYTDNLTEFDISVTGSAAPEDAYGGVGYYNNPNGTNNIVTSSSDVVEEGGPHGIVVMNDNTTGVPLGVFSYGTIGTLGPADPKGMGADVQTFTSCMVMDCEATVSLSQVCEGASVTFGASGTFGSSYSWSGPNGFNSNSQNPTRSGLTTLDDGTYTVTIFDVNGVEVSSCSVDLTVNANPVVNAGSYGPFCLDDAAVVLTGTPAGGTFSGTGVSGGNTFTPSVAGVGTFNITYSYTDGNGCSNTDITAISVFALPVVTFTAPADLCIDAGEQTGLGGGSPSGGVYSGAGVTDDGNGTTYSFDPAAAGAGVQTVTYEYTDGNGCTNSANDDVEVFALPVVTFTAPADLCIDAGEQIGLGGGSPSGGVYSGAGVTDDGNGTTYSFDPAAAGAGLHTITYENTDGNSCTNSANDDVEVFALPVVTFTAPADLCIDAGEQIGLGGGSPTGGVYSGAGVTDDGNGTTYSFDPAAAGAGLHTITYENTDGNSCTNSANDDVEVFALPVVTFTALADLCIDAGVQAGLGGGLPSGAGGVYSGSGITDDGNGTTYSFDPAAAGAGVQTVTYEYTDANGCTDSANDDVEVFALPVVTFTALADLCIDAGVQAGLSGGSPSGGVYSGAGVTDDGNGTTYSFDPAAAGAGLHTITYENTDGNSCTNSANDDVEVFALPVVTFTAPADLCIDAGEQIGLGGGSPTGGVYSGAGVTDDGNGTTYSFDPAAAGAGVQTVTYEYTDGNGCTDSANDDVEVFALPVVTFTALADLCIDAGVQAGLSGGSPTGGVYSGAGVTDDGNGTTYSFDPAAAGAGVQTVTYEYTDANGCTNSANDDVEVFALPVVTFTAPADLCIDAGEQIGLGGGSPSGGIYSGAGVTDDGNGTTYSFDPAAAGAGLHTITYEYTDGNSCTNSANDDVEVFALPVVAFTAPADLCVDAGVQAGLGGGTPTGGVYSGTGVTDDGNGTTYSFDPAAAGAGLHTITYEYTDGNSCTNSANDDVEVFALPVVTFTALADLCIDAGVQAGLGGGLPSGAGGVYSGSGITDDGNGTTYSFDPAAAGAGVHTITYTFTDVNGCTDSASDDVEVFALPIVTFTALADLCIDAGVQAGLGGGTPTGGVYSGPGVTDNGDGMTYDYDQASAGVGVHTLTYTYTDGNGCTDSANDDVEVFALPVVTFTALADLCIDAGVQAGLSGGSPSGGVYSGAGVTDDGNGITYSFDPAVAGLGTHTITYEYTDGNSCTNSANDDVEVFALPVVTFTALADLCIDAGVQAGLSGGSPSGGVYSGAGVIDDGNGITYSFDPAAAGAGVQTVTYEYTGGNGCTDSANDDVEVFALPVVTFTALADLCVDSGVQAGLDGGTPTGGVYSGPGVTDNGDGMTYDFDPATAGVGVHTITYTFTDANSCTDSAIDDVEVFALPIVTFIALSDLCIDAGIQAGLGGGSPTGGVYSGTGVIDDGNGITYSFDPAAAGVGTHTITYTFTDANGCTDSASDDVEVFALPIVTFTAPADLCIDAGLQAGLGGGTPTGGVYSGPGVTDDGNGTTYSFDPAIAGAGVQTITYEYTDGNGCTDSANDDVEVFALPVVTFTAPADLCIDAGLQAGLGGGTPSGGVYSGAGVTDDGNGTTYSFDPALAGAGVQIITYTFTNGNGCTSSASDDVEVYALPVVTFTALADLCVDAGVQAGLGGGTPTGGVYSGTGVIDDGNGITYSFDPAAAGVGTHTITYTFTDANGCTDSASDDVEVYALPVVTFTALADLCIDAGVQAGLSGGSPTGGVYSGAGVTDDGNGTTYSFDPAGAGVGVHTITYEYTDGNGCTNSANDDVEVFALPVVTFTALADLCNDAGVQAGLGGGTPIGGVYSGQGVTDDGNGMTYSFNPSTAGVGIHSITYTYTDGNGCENSTNDDVEVFALPAVTFTAPADLCIDVGIQAAQTGGSPIGGVYSGAGVTDDGNGMTYSFNPSIAGLGVHSITYNYTDINGCKNSDSDDVEVFALPVVTFTAPADLCIDAGVQAGLGGSSPSGGVYSGAGVTDDGNGTTYSFDPAIAGAGVQTITYEYTDGNGCTDSASDDVEVFALPVVTFTALADLCVDSGVQAGLDGGTPTGGVYSGPGVTDNGDGMTYDFDPATAGVGVHTITYTFTDANSCTDSAIDDVEVFALPIVTFIALSDLCIDAGIQAGLGGGSPTGGVYSGTGVIDDGNGITYSFDPAAAGVGTHTITYTFTDANGCTDSASDDVEVFALPIVTFTAPADLCIDAGLQAGLGGGTPTGGVYSGPGVTDDRNGTTYSFDPAIAGAGVQTITYEYTDGNGCTDSANDDVEVFAIPVVTFTAPADLCIDAGLQAGLGGGTPSGGVYSGAGVTDDGNGTTYSFDPALAGAGVQIITYTFTNGNGCTSSASDDVEVYALPVVTFTALADLCVDAGVQAGLGGGTPTGGVYSGTGVIDDGNGITYSFDPAAADVGTHTITYTFTDANGCTDSANDDVEVFALTVVTFTALTDLCIDAGVQAGLGGGSPTGGVYSGPGVTDNGDGMTYDFDPASAGIGLHILTYTYTDGNGCTDSANDDVEVFALPVVTFTALADLCVDAGLQAGLGGGTPSGGVYSGAGVTDDGNGTTYSFDPAIAGAGAQIITYTFTNGNGCTNVANDDVEVFALPVVTFTTLPDLCVDAGVQAGLGGGTPTGGVYGGPGVTDDGNGMTYSFDPAVAGVGQHLLTYGYTDSNGCNNFNFDDVEVFALPVVTFTALADLCIDAGVQAGLGGGLPSGAGGVYSGSGITDDGNGMTYSFDPAVAGAGVHTITYTFTDANGCTDSANDDLEVFDLPVVTFIAPSDLCIDAGIQMGLSNGSPSGGVYSGVGVTDDGNGMTYSFDPVAAGSGVHNITYTFTDGNSCINSANDNIEVFALPVVTLNDPFDRCRSGDDMTFTGSLLPDNINTFGTFSISPFTTAFTDLGDGNGVLDVSEVLADIYTITYTFNDENGCSSSASSEVDICSFDLALTKTTNVSLSASPISPDSLVVFDITVTNQGSLTAYNIQVSDYIPSGLDLFDGNWTQIGDTARLINPITDLLVGEDTTVQIAFIVESDFMDFSITNNAEIESAEDVMGNEMADDDSVPGDQDGSILDEDDDDITELNGDDDYDPAEVEITQIFDLALIKQVDTSTPPPYSYNSTVTFAITVRNQGTRTASDIEITDYVPIGYDFDPNSGNNLNKWSGTFSNYVFTISELLPNQDTVVLIDLIIKMSASEDAWTNYAEITNAFDADGSSLRAGTLLDIDSNAGSNNQDENNVQPGDTEDDDFDSTDIGGEEDDHDPAGISIYDLAQIKELVTSGPHKYGDIVDFEITVFNQGNVESKNIQITDYIPCGFEYIAANNSFGWNYDGQNATYTITSILGPNESFIAPLQLRVVPCYSNAGSAWTNISEISSSESNDPNVPPIDIDSQEDLDPNNDGPVIDDNIENDVLDCTNCIQTLSVPSLLQSGAPLIVSEVTVDGEVLVLNYPYNLGSTFGIITLTNDISALGYTTEYNIGLYYTTISVIYPGVEFTGAIVDGLDAGWDCHDCQGPFVTDEDDHDIEELEIFDLALTKTIDNKGPYGSGEIAEYVINVINQGNVTATNIEVTDYLNEGYIFNPGDNTGWSVSVSDPNNLVYIINTPLLPGETTQLILRLEVTIPVGANISSWYNEAEISYADDDNDVNTTAPEDADSTPDSDPDNDNDLVDGPDDDPIFDEDDNNDNVINENPNDPFGLGDDDEDDNDAADILVVGGLGGTVWKDLDGDGIQDIGEMGVESVVVTLTDCEGNEIDQQTTGLDGFYFFENLLPGDYQVNFDITGLPEGCAFTLQDQGVDDEVDSDVNNFGVGPCTSIQGGEYDTTYDAGLLAIVNIGDFVWHDLDGDGIQDTGEPGIPGVQVVLYDDENNFIASVYTDVNGYYIFENIYPGDYYILFVDPEGFTVTEANQGNDLNDSDATGAITNTYGTSTDLFTVLAGVDDYSFDAGYFKCIPIGELVWYDTDEDDIWDSNENGINGIEVVLWRKVGGVWSIYETQYTGHKPGTPSDDGYYKFCAPPGTYYIQVIMPPYGLVLARANAINNLPLTHPNEPGNDSDMTNNFGMSTTAQFSVQSGEMFCNIGAGYYPMAVAGNRVWEDVNLNGLQDANEPNMANVKVEAYEAATGEMVAEAYTNNEGIYELDYLRKEDYYLKFTPPSGFGFTGANVGNEDIDSDVDHSNGWNTTGIISMSPGMEIMNIDAGIANGILPVEWMNIAVNRVDNNNLIDWSTATEINSDKYIIERMIGDKSFFEEIGQVKSNGNTIDKSSYSFMDYDAEDYGIYYYRIKQLDLDGTYDYSDIVSLRVDGEREIELYPNPTRDILNYKVSVNNETSIQFIIYDSSGKIVKSIKDDRVYQQGSYESKLDVQELGSGVYTVKIMMNNDVITKNVIIID